jgi:hypothetical protein
MKNRMNGCHENMMRKRGRREEKQSDLFDIFSKQRPCVKQCEKMIRSNENQFNSIQFN